MKTVRDTRAVSYRPLAAFVRRRGEAQLVSLAVIWLHLLFIDDTSRVSRSNHTDSVRVCIEKPEWCATTSGGEKSARTHPIIGAADWRFYQRHSVSVSNHTPPGVDCRFIRARDRLESEKGITHSDWRRPYIIINDTSRVG